MALFPEAHDNEMVDVRHILLVWNGFGGFDNIWSGGSEEKEVNRLHNVIMPYITEHL